MSQEQQGRRKFILKSTLAVAGFPFLGRYLAACSKPKAISFPGKLSGPSFKAGHLLRKGIALIPTEVEEVDVVIVGGGASGLSANRWLHQHSHLKVVLLEMEAQLGGNAAAGENDHTAFPWGAHYLPLPNNKLFELLDFLEEEKVISGYSPDNLPIYQEEYLCFDPEERLFIHNYWQNGLVPHWGVPESDKKEFERFFALIETFRLAKGTDNKEAFAIPISDSSADAEFRALDEKSLEIWLQEHRFTSEYLFWYLNYCCLDDYGSRLSETSAWAGIHYFASRKAKAAGVNPDRVLTWPEGNNWLIKRLRKSGESNIKTNALTYRVSLQDNQVLVDYLDLKTEQPRRIRAKQSILATPQFVNERLLDNIPEIRSRHNFKAFSYSTWLVANITLKQVPAGRGTPLCWDNVIYGSDSLGYVYANHQQMRAFPVKQTITFYYPLTGNNLGQVRGEAYQKTKEAWQEIIIKELEKAHPAIRRQIETLDVWVWGHGMIRPTVGFIWGKEKAVAATPIQNKIFFAHTDLSGISVFEEAFYQGLKVAQHVIKVNHVFS